jgi:hypothetical protein
MKSVESWNCSYWENKLAAGHVDDLLPFERNTLHEHMAICPKCAATHAIFNTVHSRIRSLPSTKPLRSLDISAPSKARFFTNAFNAAMPKLIVVGMLLTWILVFSFQHTYLTLTGAPGEIASQVTSTNWVSQYAYSTLTRAPKPATPIYTLSDAQLVINDVEHYDGLVLDGSVSAYHKAYNKLDVSLRNQEPYDDFVTNSNFTLGKGYWQDHQDQIAFTQVDSSTWIAALPMTKVTYVDKTLLGQYIWYFKVRIVYGFPEIVAVALQPNS